MATTADERDQSVETKAADPDSGSEMETVTLQLPADTLSALREEARKRNVSTGDMVRIAIGTHKFLAEKIDKGAKVVLRDSRGTYDVSI